MWPRDCPANAPSPPRIENIQKIISKILLQTTSANRKIYNNSYVKISLRYWTKSVRPPSSGSSSLAGLVLRFLPVSKNIHVLCPIYRKKRRHLTSLPAWIRASGVLKSEISLAYCELNTLFELAGGGRPLRGNALPAKTPRDTGRKRSTEGGGGGDGSCRGDTQ